MKCVCGNKEFRQTNRVTRLGKLEGKGILFDEVIEDINESVLCDKCGKSYNDEDLKDVRISYKL